MSKPGPLWTNFKISMILIDCDHSGCAEDRRCGGRSRSIYLVIILFLYSYLPFLILLILYFIVYFFSRGRRKDCILGYRLTRHGKIQISGKHRLRSVVHGWITNWHPYTEGFVVAHRWARIVGTQTDADWCIGGT